VGGWCGRFAPPGVTIILTTHYIEEAELMADRVGGHQTRAKMILVEDKAAPDAQARQSGR